MKFYFYIGLAIIVASEALLFAGVKWVHTFFTPLVWTGYILFMDAIVFRIKKKSWITGGCRTFLLMTLLSAVFWYIFEFFNLFLKNWGYVGLPSLPITIIGMTWAFATIGPGMFETSDFLAKGRLLPRMGRGDLLSVFSAGAYGFVMSCTYNSRPRCAEVLVEGDTWRIIRRAETWDDLLAPEREV